MEYQKITMLENLPEPSSNIGNPGSSIKQPRYIPSSEMLPPTEHDKFKKFIRVEHEPLPEAGMAVDVFYNNGHDDRNQPPPQKNSQHYENNHVHKKTHPILKKKKKYNCNTFSKHIEQCSVCTKLYSSDKNIYILFIIFLLSICFLLFKKILSV
jgi:hypothetical protein